MDDATFTKLERLGRLRQSGVLSDLEFEQKKGEVLSGQLAPATPERPAWTSLKRRQRITWITLLGLICWPVALYFMWTRQIFSKHRDGPRPVGVVTKLFLTAFYLVNAVYWMTRF